MFCCGLLWFVVVVCHCLLWLAVVCCEGRSLQVVILYWTGVRARARYGLVRMGSLRMLVVVLLLFVVVCCELLWFVVCWLWFRHLSRIFRAYSLTCTSNLRVQTYMRMSIHACNATCAHTALHAHINRACKSTRAHQPTHTALHAHQSTHTTLHAHINPRIQPYMRTSNRACNSTCAHQSTQTTLHAHINPRIQPYMRTLIHAYSPTCAH